MTERQKTDGRNHETFLRLLASFGRSELFVSHRQIHYTTIYSF